MSRDQIEELVSWIAVVASLAIIGLVQSGWL